MTSTRVLAVMALVRDTEAPLKTFNASVRKATRTATDSDENDAAQARGNAALLEIEAAVRRWVAKHPAADAEPVTQYGFRLRDTTLLEFDTRAERDARQADFVRAEWEVTPLTRQVRPAQYGEWTEEAR